METQRNGSASCPTPYIDLSLPFIDLALPIICLSLTHHCLFTTFHRPTTAFPLPFIDQPLPFHCLSSTYHCLFLKNSAIAGSRRLFCEGVPLPLTKDRLIKHFAGFGEVTDWCVWPGTAAWSSL